MSAEAESEDSPAAGLGAGRVEALADGVFAVVLTLLVLDLKVPHLEPNAPVAALNQALLALWPQALAYLVTFVNAGTLWVAHRAQYHYIQRTDRLLLWINLLFLMLISLIPFSTALLGEYHAYRTPLVLYGVNLGLAVLTLYGHWRYATGKAHLVAPHLSAEVVQRQARRVLSGPPLYLAAMALAFVLPWASLLLYALIPLVYIVPGSIDRHWRHAR